MKTRDIIRRAGRSLRHAKVRTLLTSLAISVGAFTVTVALAAGAGGQAYTDSLVKNNGDQRSLTVYPKADDEGATDAPKEHDAASTAKQGVLVDSDVEKIRKVNGVSEITPAYNISAAYMTREAGAKKYDTEVAMKVDRTAMPLAAGSLTDNQVPAGGVVVPESYLSALGFKNAKEAIGKTLQVRVEKPGMVMSGAAGEGKDLALKIVAVNKKSTAVLHYSPALTISTSDGKAIYDYQTENTGRDGQYYALTVRVKDGADVKTVQAAIQKQGYTVFSLQDLQEALFQFIDIVQWGAAGFGLLAILASVFGIINTQYISVLERTQQIGLMKALGARRRDIGRLFRYEAAWVGFLGGIIGTGLAVSMGLLNPWITKTLDLEPGTQLLLFEPMTSVVLVVSLMVVAVAAGYFPSRKAAKLDPIEALRTE
jgi:putative ABC transport system permease protein